VVLLAVEEVQAVLHFLYRDGVFVSSVLEDELFEEQEGALVLDFLSDLDKGSPSVFSGKSCTVRTLHILDEEFDLEYLFEDGSSQDLVNKA
jgi:hypothetical protein